MQRILSVFAEWRKVTVTFVMLSVRMEQLSNIGRFVVKCYAGDFY